MPENSEEEFDKSCRLIDREFDSQGYTQFLEATIEEMEDVVIHTTGTGRVKELIKGIAKGSYYTIRHGSLGLF